MNGEGADATLNGLVLIGGNQHVDNHTLLDHAFPNCPSHELYKHVLDGKSTGVFKGKILVRQPAQKTDSKQTSKALMLSDDAVMNSMPALEIYADDVKCTHGSSSGPVDEDQVFYLRTRGVGLEAARHLMTYAFAADITRRIRVEPVRRRLEEYMAAQHGLPLDLRITDLARMTKRCGNCNFFGFVPVRFSRSFRGEGARFICAHGYEFSSHACSIFPSPSSNGHPVFDVRKIRADFPILQTTAHGKPLVYLDNAATTQKPRAVIDRLVRYYETENANIHRGVYELSQKATSAYEEARHKVAQFLNAAEDREIIFTRGTTEAINLVAVVVWPDDS